APQVSIKAPTQHSSPPEIRNISKGKSRKESGKAAEGKAASRGGENSQIVKGEIAKGGTSPASSVGSRANRKRKGKEGEGESDEAVQARSSSSNGGNKSNRKGKLKKEEEEQNAVEGGRAAAADGSRAKRKRTAEQEGQKGGSKKQASSASPAESLDPGEKKKGKRKAGEKAEKERVATVDGSNASGKMAGADEGERGCAGNPGRGTKEEGEEVDGSAAAAAPSVSREPVVLKCQVCQEMPCS
ncbi:MAG: hypothetical protein SGPRY_014101, partial [Prymnesium sp.]